MPAKTVSKKKQIKSKKKKSQPRKPAKANNKATARNTKSAKRKKKQPAEQETVKALPPAQPGMGYSLQAEFYNAITHAIGLGFSLAATMAMLYLAIEKNDLYTTIGSLVFGLSMILLYLTSVLYHGTIDESKKKLLKRVDHIAIFVFIAGTYTPFLLVWMRDTFGIIMLSIIWLAALLGIAMKLSHLKFSKLVNSLPYIFMGWMVLFFIKPFVEVAPAGCLWLFFSGGLFYTGGVFFYVKHTEYSHSIWHLFVLLGSTAHFFAALLYLY